ncbi:MULTISPECIES: TonB-dependent receptor domain-containing protein [Tatumella]|uniref:TonB-dependent receptor domain-containing protein n=1 Tax=Tatumella punctata TaxID=399969 RepID=A0ABW1VS80_9GAMM|nr:TonB-dependent receptor [Tatumella sp. JGM130]MBS0894441.1 TonB-dependent receptor [Tatumella sp. JGM130]
MHKFINQGKIKPVLFQVTAIAISVHAACSLAATDSPSAGDDQDAGAQITVRAAAPQLRADNRKTLTAEQMQKQGANDFGSLMRYQTLVSATGASGGSGNGKSGFDRGGYTGYNIRGMESNRVGIDVDGVELPSATGRGYVGRTGVNTFGIGRDYIDPYLFGVMDIDAGATAVSQPNTSIGGIVSFRTKSPDDYLSPDKSSYFGYQSDYDSSDRGWHNGITAAAGDEALRGIFVLSRRDGQQTRNNSGTLSAYPANWHSTAFLATGIWQPDDLHTLTGTFSYYDKTNHTHYDTWDSGGTAVIGTSHQSSATRRAGINLQDEYTPLTTWIDSLTTRFYWQKTHAHDNTLAPYDTGVIGRTHSDYNTDSIGLSSEWRKTTGRHELSAGLNASEDTTKRPFSQSPLPLAYYSVMQPEADSKSTRLGAFVRDRINFAIREHNFAITPGVRVAYQKTRPQNLSSLTAGSSVLTTDAVSTLYGSGSSDTQILPSLTLQYSLNPQLLTYIKYQRGAEFPNASQLYGSWNLGSSYAGRGQYALIGNSALKTETSNNFEWGLTGQLIPGVTFSGSLFYNQYDNFIAYTRYNRSSSPGMFSRVPSNIYTIYQAENRDKAFIYGGEINTRINIGHWVDSADGLSASLALGYTQGKSKSSLSGDSYTDLDSVAPMKAVAGVAWDDPSGRWGSAVTATFVKGKQAQQTTRDTITTGTVTSQDSPYMRIPGYGMVDATAYWRVTKNVKLSGGVYNITDRKYIDYLSSRELKTSTPQDRNNVALAVMPGRTFQLGLNVDF